MIDDGAKIKQLIINSPYSEPDSYWHYNKETKNFDRVHGRRKSGFRVAKDNDEDGEFFEIELVNRIRPRVKSWRENNYEGVTNTTRDLLFHWHDESVRDNPLFFCQTDAIETLIFLSEAPANLRAGILIPNDGSKFTRLCTKLCTGGGKTIVMAMLIAWQICNKVNYPRDKRFSKNIMIAAPNLTVKKRLQVLLPNHNENYYDRFSILPANLREKINQGKIIIHNWQAFSWDNENDIAKRKSVDKRGMKSDNAYSREILYEFPNANNIVVINDEAHHAWRVTPEMKSKRKSKEEKEEQREATIWLGGLDRIHNARNILACYDFSATPFVPGRGRNDSEGLFSWIVSDFSLSDGIESGLVKTPRIAVRDSIDGDKTKFSRLYSQPEVKNNLSSPEATDVTPLPDLVRNAYMLLGRDWEKTFSEWKLAGKNIPPVMISVANSTQTAARIENEFLRNTSIFPELSKKILRIDSKVLEGKSTEEAEKLREVADTVGKEGMPGAEIRNVISVGMLSEGWDAHNVTQIMGLRAFTSQLLCEQVIGRGLRRTVYEIPKGEKFFSPEYVNVFGIPFDFLPHEDSGGGKIRESFTGDKIEVLPERESYRISWPDVLRIEHVMRQKLILDVKNVPEIELNAERTKINAELAPVIDGKINIMMCSDIDLEKLYANIRMQKIIFEVSGRVYDLMKNSTQWQNEGPKLYLLGQVIKLVEEYINGGTIKIFPELFETAKIRRKIMIAMNMEKIIMHLWSSIKSESSEKIIASLSSKREFSTGEMHYWYTNRPNNVTRKSHINRCVYDSTWENSEAYSLDRNEHVKSWVKNDHLGFCINYMFNGILKRYFPDFLIKLDNDTMLILEVKGQSTEQDKAKRNEARNWVSGVNELKEFGKWAYDISRSPADVDGIIAKYIS